MWFAHCVRLLMLKFLQSIHQTSARNLSQQIHLCIEIHLCVLKEHFHPVTFFLGCRTTRIKVFFSSCNDLMSSFVAFIQFCFSIRFANSSQDFGLWYLEHLFDIWVFQFSFRFSFWSPRILVFLLLSFGHLFYIGTTNMIGGFVFDLRLWRQMQKIHLLWILPFDKYFHRDQRTFYSRYFCCYLWISLRLIYHLIYFSVPSPIRQSSTCFEWLSKSFLCLSRASWICYSFRWKLLPSIWEFETVHSNLSARHLVFSPIWIVRISDIVAVLALL